MSKKPAREVMYILDPSAEKMIEAENLTKASKEEKADKIEKDPDLGVLSQILKSLQSTETENVQRMAFEVDPKTYRAGTQGLWVPKQGLTPDHVIKRITGPNGNELVCQILQARSNHIASLGRRRTSRFAMGYEFQEINKDSVPDDENLYDQLQNQIDEAKELFWNCGYDGLDEISPMNLSQLLKMVTRDGLSFGRFAVEIIHTTDPLTGKKKPHSFRPVDAGTIYRIIPWKEADQSARSKALDALSKIKNEKFDREKYRNDEYTWVQVIDGNIAQAFSHEELVVYNLYPVNNVEYNQYPLSPIDQALNAITTNINITIWNKLYFQNGRAAKGAWIFKSDNIEEKVVQSIRNQHTQSINSVTNAHRVPVFGVGMDEELTWQQVEANQKDAEFQYLMDNNSRIVLSAFQMSPEELPGYAHLARGTNTQALSESDNEYKLVAARDVGLRPLIFDIQDFFNTHVLPQFFPELAKVYQFTFAGLDHDSPEKEATRIQQDMPIHMTYDEIMERVEKDKLGAELGGKFPLNPQMQQVIQSYLSFGEILEAFFDRKGAASDPRFAFYMNPFWMQNQQMLVQKAQMAQQNQMMAMQQQMAMQQPQAPEGQPAPAEKSELASYHEQNFETLNKAIKNNHDHLTKEILAHHDAINKKKLKEWEDHSKQSLNKIKETLGVKDEPKKKKSPKKK